MSIINPVTFSKCPSTLEWAATSLRTHGAQSSGAAAVYALTRLYQGWNVNFSTPRRRTDSRTVGALVSCAAWVVVKHCPSSPALLQTDACPCWRVRRFVDRVMEMHKRSRRCRSHQHATDCCCCCWWCCPNIPQIPRRALHSQLRQRSPHRWQKDWKNLGLPTFAVDTNWTNLSPV